MSDGSSDGQEPPGRLRPISARTLGPSVALGLVAGWSAHRLIQAVTSQEPRVSWVQPLTLALVALIVGFLAGHTWRTVQVRGHRLEARFALNRLVLARACAVAGALIAGCYVGFAVSWLGDASQLADRWIARSLLAALAAGAVVAASLALESACRTPSDRSRP